MAKSFIQQASNQETNFVGSEASVKILQELNALEKHQQAQLDSRITQSVALYCVHHCTPRYSAY